MSLGLATVFKKSRIIPLPIGEGSTLIYMTTIFKPNSYNSYLAESTSKLGPKAMFCPFSAITEIYDCLFKKG